MEGKKQKESDASFYWISPSNFKFYKVEEINYSSRKKITLAYDNYESIKGQLFPSMGQLSYEDEKPFVLKLEYSRIELNNPQKLPFSISQKYERIY